MNNSSCLVFAYADGIRGLTVEDSCGVLFSPADAWCSSAEGPSHNLEFFPLINGSIGGIFLLFDLNSFCILEALRVIFWSCLGALFGSWVESRT